MNFLAFVFSLVFIASTSCSFFPLNKNGEVPLDIEPYDIGQSVYFGCNARDIDKNGEHKFDDKGDLVFTNFPICKETGKPLSFHYGMNEDIQCTIVFSDELYHLFQIYVHQDAPFSCRIPLSTEKDSLEKGGASIPLNFNFRGEIHESHLLVDTSLNVLLTTPSAKNKQEQTIVSAIAWSSSTNTTRVVIGSEVTFDFAVRWFNNLKNTGSSSDQGKQLPFHDGFYMLPKSTIPMSYKMFSFYLLVTSIVTSVIILACCYKSINVKLEHNKYKDF
ncbi:Piso0_003247 [Millerozyma farinosa CBS 7064]|uniref:Piso0_003247 protein n=1 Tax=Pichia sorbitophila (strain ATCC MYA-4447 / BCRC 22081 / CBS 7064 / NBRC 10061 / NRRL Y-12695) TaxID=559304 RepID=G8YIK2_PICSO|nr:Piso0_003247 [Millerozyma farinosa CBS 7064]CCE80912.1 Piso0_003247 [Millerozyma farinosa CBS 7064]